MRLYGATAYIDGCFQPNITVETDNGKITAVREGARGGADALDLHGDYLLPGFVDVHIHAFKGMDTMDGEKAVRHMSRELKKQGVAAFLPTTMSASMGATREALAGVAAVMASPEPDGAIVLGAHMEAPFLSVPRAGAQLTKHFRQPSLAEYEAFTGEHAHVVRMITLAPELEGAVELIRYLTKNGVVVSAGHTDATAEELHRAADNGLSHTTHTFNASSPLVHRMPGVPGSAMVDDRIYCEFIGDGIHLHPDVVRLIARAKGPERAVAITDAMEAAGMSEGKYKLGGQDVFVEDDAARLMDGTLAGSTLTMVTSLRNMILRFGIAPKDAVMMATRTPALSIGNTDVGIIGVGAPAIMSRFDSDWNFMGIVG